MRKFFCALLSLYFGLVIVFPLLAQENDDLGKDASTEINVKNADISAIIKIFSKKTKRNYIMDENVKGKVTIYLPGRVSSDEAIRILETVLALKGFTSVPVSENLWKIVPARQARGDTIPTQTERVDEPPTGAIVTRLVPLKYVSAEDMQQLLSQLISANGMINAYTGTNSLIVIDSEDNVERLMDIIDALDIPFTDREMTIISIAHAEATDIAEKLNEILGKTDSPSSDGPAGLDTVRARIRQAQTGQPPRSNQTEGAAGDPGSTTVSSRSREPKIIPDERTNSIILLADDDTTERIAALVEQLDSPVDRSGKRFYVYRCQHANAAELAEVLSGLAGSGNSTTKTGTSSAFGSSQTNRTGSSLSSSNLANRSRSQTTQSRLESQQRTPGRSRTENQERPGVSAVSFGEDVSITADPATNSLVINASRADYMKITELLDDLDIKRRQVLVEAMLLEVAMKDSHSLGTEFIASTGGSDGGAMATSNFGNLATLLSDPRRLSGFSAAAASAGTLNLPNDIQIPTQTILLSAAHSNENVNILSAPNIMTADNEQAEIVVGENVPFLASVSSSEDNLSNVFNQVDRQDVGITLRITPRISAGDFVTLNIFTEVSDVVAGTAASSLGPTTKIRTSETTVIAKDGQMIVTGGLMADAGATTSRGVPFLRDIPVLGHLFRASAEDVRRTNLLIFITPRIIRDQYDARDTTLTKREYMEDVIAFEESYPARQNVLRNPGIDNVAEINRDEHPTPSTILPPNKSKDAELHTTKEFLSDSDGVIELRIAPKLPPVGGAVENTGETQSSHELGEDARAAPRHLADNYFVMSVVNYKSMPENLPFKANAKRPYFGIIIPAESAISARNYFKIGEMYKYRTQGQELEIVPTDLFSSADEAHSIYADIGDDWYTLSPHEIMNLGQGPWYR